MPPSPSLCVVSTPSADRQTGRKLFFDFLICCLFSHGPCQHPRPRAPPTHPPCRCSSRTQRHRARLTSRWPSSSSGCVIISSHPRYDYVFPDCLLFRDSEGACCLARPAIHAPSCGRHGVPAGPAGLARLQQAGTCTLHPARSSLLPVPSTPAARTPAHHTCRPAGRQASAPALAPRPSRGPDSGLHPSRGPDSGLRPSRGRALGPRPLGGQACRRRGWGLLACRRTACRRRGCHRTAATWGQVSVWGAG